MMLKTPNTCLISYNTLLNTATLSYQAFVYSAHFPDALLGTLTLPLLKIQHGLTNNID